MSFELVPDMVLHGRYAVRKLIHADERVRTYDALDHRVTDRAVLVFEYLPASDTPSRRVLYQQAVESVSLFSHPGLAHVVDHFAESGREYLVTEAMAGVALSAMCQMSVGGLEQKGVVPWLLQLADALEYLHSRPRPFVLGGLDATTIFVGDDRVVIGAYNLERCWTEARPQILVAEREACQGDYVAFGRLVLSLLAPEGHSDLDGALGGLVRRCLEQPERPTFKSFAEVRQALQHLGDPGEPEALQFGPVAATLGGAPVAERPAPAAWPSQDGAGLPLWMAGAVLVLIALVGAGAFLLYDRTHTFRKDGPLTYAACETAGLWAFDPVTGRVRDHKRLHDVVLADACPIDGGSRLLLLDSRNSRIMVIDTSSDEVEVQVSVDQQPDRMVADEMRGMLYCLSGTSRTISVVSLGSMQLTNVFTLPYPATALVPSVDGRYLFVTVRDQNILYALDASNGRIVSTVSVPGGPAALCRAGDAQQVWIACAEDDTVKAYDVSEPDRLPDDPVAVVTDLKGKRPVQITWSPDNLTAWVLCQDTATISELRLSDRQVRRSFSTGGLQPCGMALAPGDSTRLWVANRGSASVTEVDDTSGQVLVRAESGRQPVAVHPVP